MEMRKVGAPPLGEKVADRLLDLLSTDDGFRELFVQDAQAAIELAGYVHSGASVAHPGLCLAVTTLASKEAIRRDREKLKRTLNSIVNFDCPRELGSR